MAKILMLQNPNKMIWCKDKKIKDMVTKTKNLYRILVPVSEEPIVQYLVIDPDKFIYEFRSCEIEFAMRYEYFLDEVQKPISFKKINLKIKTPSELYQALHNLNMIKAFQPVVQDRISNNSVFSSLDIGSFSINLIDSNLGDFHYETSFDTETTTQGRYLHAETILKHIKKIYDPLRSVEPKRLLAVYPNNTWDIIDDFDYCCGLTLAMEMANYASVFISPDLYLNLDALDCSDECFFDIILYDNRCSAIDLLSTENMNQMLKDPSILQIYETNVHDVRDLILYLSMNDYMTQCFTLIETVYSYVESPKYLGILYDFTFPDYDDIADTIFKFSYHANRDTKSALDRFIEQFYTIMPINWED